MISSLNIILDLIRQQSNHTCIEANLFDDNNYLETIIENLKATIVELEA